MNLLKIKLNFHKFQNAFPKEEFSHFKVPVLQALFLTHKVALGSAGPCVVRYRENGTGYTFFAKVATRRYVSVLTWGNSVNRTVVAVCPLGRQYHSCWPNRMHSLWPAPWSSCPCRRACSTWSSSCAIQNGTQRWCSPRTCRPIVPTSGKKNPFKTQAIARKIYRKHLQNCTPWTTQWDWSTCPGSLCARWSSPPSPWPPSSSRRPSNRWVEATRWTIYECYGSFPVRSPWIEDQSCPWWTALPRPCPFSCWPARCTGSSEHDPRWRLSKRH